VHTDRQHSYAQLADESLEVPITTLAVGRALGPEEGTRLSWSGNAQERTSGDFSMDDAGMAGGARRNIARGRRGRSDI
jgi:hypothetical protein